MKDEARFFDTNVLIYALAKGDPRSKIAEELLAKGGTVGIQVLNEFVAVATRKLGMPWAEILEVLDVLRILFPHPVPVTVDTHDMALRIFERYGYGIYDALVIAAALQARATTLYSEDMRDGQVIDGLAIRNPFK